MEFERADLVVPGPVAVYPAPLFSHEELFKNRTTFLETLFSFHLSMGTRFKNPVIGGKELDLHLLYVQVTQRGGLEKVVLQKKWSEVIPAFNFPRTTTSASFVLRKHYLSLLYHFEQVYFFRVHGPVIPPPAALQTRVYLSKPYYYYSKTTPEYSQDPPEESVMTTACRTPLFNDHGHAASCSVPPPPTIGLPVSCSVPFTTASTNVLPVTAPTLPTPATSALDSITGNPTTDHRVPSPGNVPLTPGAGNALPASGTIALSPSAVPRFPPSRTVPLLPPSPGNGLPTSITDPPATATSNGFPVSDTATGRRYPPLGSIIQDPVTGFSHFTLRGTINKKFQYGYLVSIEGTSGKLHGFLYQPAQNDQEAFSSTTTTETARNVAGPSATSAMVHPRRRRPRYRDPAHPKQNRSAYNFFFAEKHAKLRALNRYRGREFSKLIAEAWNKLTQQEREVYRDLGRRDKERYRREKQEYYRERMNVAPPARESGPKEAIEMNHPPPAEPSELKVEV